MKKVFTIFTFLLSLAVYAQKQKLVSVELSIRDCRTNHSILYRTRGDTISLNHISGDTSFKIITDRFSSDPLELANIPIGSYSLLYRNSLGQKITKKIVVSDNDSNFFHLCLDSLSNYKQNRLARLLDGDSITINYASFGCFHGFSKTIVLKKLQCQLIAFLYDADAGFVRKKKTSKMQFKKLELLQKSIFSPSNILDFIRFENELNLIDDGGCTTTDWYEMIGKQLNIEKVDGTCSWHGFDFLFKSLFRNTSKIE